MKGPGEGLAAREAAESGPEFSLAFGLIGARAFPPVRLPLLVKSTNADPLAAPH